MKDDIEKDNSLNPEEEETSEEETSQEEETSDNSEMTSSELEKGLSEKNKRLYARMKKAEEEAKRLKEQLESKPKPVGAVVDPFDLAKTVSALKDYSPEELDFISMLSRAKSLSPEEAAKTEEAKLYVAALREKVAKEKQTPEPSSPSAKSKRLEDIGKMSPEEHKRLFEESLRQRKGGGEAEV